MWNPNGLFGITNIDTFREMINSKFDVNLKTYWDLHQWSIDNYSQFWEQFWHFSHIIDSAPNDLVIDKQKRIDEIPVWFSGAKLNYAQNILENPANVDEKVALYIAGESHSKTQ